MGDSYILALDQGTSSTRAILFNHRYDLVFPPYQIEFTAVPIAHRHDWIEHDALKIVADSRRCIAECMRIASEEHGVTAAQVKALGITNQRETTVVWHRETGRPLYNAIVWSDMRTHDTCEKLRAEHDPERIKRISGLEISTYFSGVKLKWMMEEVPEVAAAIENGTAMFGTIDTWLVWNLSKERSHVTDVTNAGRTMLMNIETLQWDDELLEMIGITRKILPEIKSCSERFGHLDAGFAKCGLEGLVIAGLIGDQQGALVGQSCFKEGQAKNTYGTGAFLIVNTGTTPKPSTHKLLTTPAYKFGDEECHYALEGSVAVAGLGVRWLRDSLGIIESPAEVETLARSVEDTDDVYFVLAFSGLFAPYWREDARGAIVGMTQSTTKAHVARATLEGVAYQVHAVLEAASKDMGAPIQQIRVDGGAAVNNLLLEMQADVTGAEVIRPKIIETTALGAAYAAGRAVGLFESAEEFTRHWELDQSFRPKIEEEERKNKLERWNRAVEKSLGWVGEKEATEPVPVAQVSDLLSQERLVSSAVGVAVGSIVTALICRIFKK